MKSVTLGSTGVRVSGLALGTATFGLQCDEQESASIMSQAADLGIDWFDTSTSYPLGSGPEAVGVTEEIVGRWVKPNRDQFFLSTKIYNRTGSASWQIGLSRKHIISAVEGSLRRLQTDHIDLLQLHRYDPLTPLEETVVALHDLIRSGHVRYIGVCNFLGHQMARAAAMSRELGNYQFSTAQVRYNLLMRGAEIEAIPSCQQEGIAILPFNILAGGLLTGKHSQKGPPKEGNRFSLGESGARYVKRYWSSENFSTVERLKVLAEEAGMPLTTLALAWSLSNEAVNVPVIGASKPRHLEAVADASQVMLEEGLLAEIESTTLSHRYLVEELKFDSS